MDEITSYLEMIENDPLDQAMDPYYYFECFNLDDMEAYLEEAEADVPKKGLVKRLLDLIVNTLDLVKAAFGRIVKWFKNLFMGKPKAKTVDQILAELGMERNPNGKGHGKIPYDSRSNLKAVPKDIELMLKPMMIEFEHDGETVTFTPMDYYRNKNSRKRQGIITNKHHATHDPRNTMTVLKFIKRPELMDEAVLIAEALLTGQLDYNTRTRVDHFFRNSITDINLNLKYEIKLKDFEIFNQKLLKINRILTKLDDTRFQVGRGDRETVEIMNRFYNAILNLQLGTTFFGSAMRSIYVIDPDYCETIRDLDVLGKFLNTMMEAGIPDKYIAFNAWMACDRSIKGNADVERPVWGMSRVTYFPPDKQVVYKLAINGWGVRSNNSEQLISDAVYKAGVGQAFAKIEYIDPTRTVVSMEKLKPDVNRAFRICEKLRSQMMQAIHTAGIPGTVEDVRPGNIGFRGDQPASFDYGMVKRTVSKKVK